MPKNNFSLYVLNDVAIIKKHLVDDPFEYKTSSELLSEVTSANRKTIEKAFKEIYGCGIKTYQLKQRLQQSKLILKEGMTIKQAAAKCLYKTQSTYCKAFKKEFRMTPTEWLNIISKETTRKMSGSEMSWEAAYGPKKTNDGTIR